MKRDLNKNTRYLLWTALIMVLSVGVSCQKEKLPNEVKTVEDAYRVIVGAWEWEKTVMQGRGQDKPIYETPETENKTIQQIFTENNKLKVIEIINNVNKNTDYEYSIIANSSDENVGSFILILTNTDSKEVHRSWFKFIDKNTWYFYHGSISFTSYFTRK
jgi:3',5'-cyclic AMP phosphodiesterase CpdA